MYKTFRKKLYPLQPSMIKYKNDGSGKDTYISFNNGGFWHTPGPLRTEKSCPRLFKRGPDLSIYRPLDRYYNDGSGRDFYIKSSIQKDYFTANTTSNWGSNFRKDDNGYVNNTKRFILRKNPSKFEKKLLRRIFYGNAEGINERYMSPRAKFGKKKGPAKYDCFGNKIEEDEDNNNNNDNNINIVDNNNNNENNNSVRNSLKNSNIISNYNNNNNNLTRSSILSRNKSEVKINKTVNLRRKLSINKLFENNKTNEDNKIEESEENKSKEPQYFEGDTKWNYTYTKFEKLPTTNVFNNKLKSIFKFGQKKIDKENELYKAPWFYNKLCIN